MKATDIPASKFPLAFAANGTKQTIPEDSQIGIADGRASLNDGFPPLTRTPIAAGGVPPFGSDMNGILFAVSAWTRWMNAGGQVSYDAAFSGDTNIGGYPLGAVLSRADGMGFWLSLTDNNTTNPDTTGSANWAPLDAYGITPVTGLTTGTVTLTPSQYGLPILTLAGTLTGNVQLIFPAVKSQWQVINNTTGNFSVTCKTTSGTGVIVQQGGSANVYGDGANIVLPTAFQVGAATQSQHAPQLSQVQSLLLGAASIPTISSATTLTSAAAGRHHIFGAAAVATLPAASSLTAGQAISFQSLFAGASVVRAGTDTITTGNGTPTSISLNAGDTLILMSNGSTGWYAVGGSTQLQYAGIMRANSTIGVPGYRLLPRYPGDPTPLIWQWGTNSGTTSGVASFSFPTSFTTAILNMQALINNTSGAASGRASYSSLSTGVVGAYRTDSATWTADPVFWQAIGY